MNIDSVGKVRAPKPGEGQTTLLITDNTRVHAKQGGVSHNFQLLYKADATNQDLFAKAVQPLLDLFIAGFNTCIIIYGESGSGKSYTMAGEQGPNSQPGLVPYAINYTMSELQTKAMGLRGSIEDPQLSGRVDGDVYRLLLYQFEIYNEVITDLMANRGAISGRGRYAMELEHSAGEGTYIKNLEYERCRTPSEALSAFWQSWQSRNVSVADFGPVKNFSTVVFQMDLTMMTTENPLPNRSKFTVVKMPGMEKLSEDLSRTRLREGPTLSKSVVAFNQLTADLARQQEPERVINYGDSKLTSILEEMLGGNCKTRVICCLPPNNQNPDVMAAVLSGCGLLTEVRNYPILNDSLAQDLVTQYRARVDASLQHGGLDLGGKGGAGMLSRSELQDQLLKITTDNTQLRERNDRLFQRLEQVQEKLTDLAKSKSELSAKLVASEEEKLKVSKGLVELQLENNRLSEEYEAENFELKNKILSLENQLVEFELERDKFSRDNDVNTQHTKHLENSRKQIADEFVSLKQKMSDLEKDHDRQVKRNNEMRSELAKLIDTEAALLDLRHNVDKQREVEDAAVKELERARSLLNDPETAKHLSKKKEEKHREKDVATEVREMREQRHGGTVKEAGQRSNPGTLDTRNDLLGNYKLVSMDDDVVKKMKSVYDDQTKNLERSLIQLRSQLAAAYETIKSANKKCAEQSTSLITAQEGYKRAKDENIQLQQQIKESNQDYRKRMWKYVQDIAEFMDENKGEKNPKTRESMKKYIDGMMKEMKTAFRSREEQLSNTARNNRKLAKTIMARHEKLLISYRSLREQLETIKIATDKQSGSSDLAGAQIVPMVQYPIELGQDESALVIDEKELQSALSIELSQLRQAMGRTKGELKATRMELERLKSRDKFPPPTTLRDILPNKSSNALPSIHSNAHDYAKTSQANAEKERAELLTRATVAEQQIVEQQEYINSHLTRYKQEINRLRRILSENGIKANSSEEDPLIYSQRYGGKVLNPLGYKS